MAEPSASVEPGFKVIEVEEGKHAASASAKSIRVAMGQIAPVFLNREKTLEKVMRAVSTAAERGADVIAFGETLVPGYPCWVSSTGGAAFNSPLQKELFAKYYSEAVNLEAGHLKRVQDLAKRLQISVVLGIAEADEGEGKSLFASLVVIAKDGSIHHVHRKLMPTYEERLVWAPGDGEGLQTMKVPPFTVGVLNCWENWMPLPRSSLYAAGEDFHIASWPGSDKLTRKISRFLAMEGRSYVMSASSVLRGSDIPPDTPHRDLIIAGIPSMLEAQQYPKNDADGAANTETSEYIFNGGSCLVAPDGEWVIKPVINAEAIIVASCWYDKVLEERQNFDPAGHYSRPDVFKLNVRKERDLAATVFTSKKV